MEYKRTDRVADQIKMEVADILSKKAKDPRIGWVTILSVDLSPDLSHAKLFVSVPNHEKETLWGLKKASGFIRSELAKRLPLRRVPELTFLVDRSVERVSRLLTLLDQAGKELAGAASSEQTAPVGGGEERDFSNRGREGSC